MIAGDSGCRVISCTTPPRAELPYRLEAPSAKYFYTGECNAVGRDPNTPNHRMDRPAGCRQPSPVRGWTRSLQGRARKLLAQTHWPCGCPSGETTKSLGPGAGSHRRAGPGLPSHPAQKVGSCCRECRPVESPSAPPRRQSAPFTGASCKVISSCTATSPLPFHGSFTEAKPSLPIETVPFPLGTDRNSNRPLSSVLVDATNEPQRSWTSADFKAAPVESRTTPSTVRPFTANNNRRRHQAQEQKNKPPR